jgi:hypothetical protein
MKTFLPLLSLASAAQALYFFIDAATPKCFYEDLPKDTLVVGHYAAEEWDDRSAAWQQHQGINIYISVDVCYPVNSTTTHPSFVTDGLSNMRAHYRRYSTTTTVSSLNVERLPANSPSHRPRLATTRSASHPTPIQGALHGSLRASLTAASS